MEFLATRLFDKKTYAYKLNSVDKNNKKKKKTLVNKND
jgi:hypothetical protein